MDGATERLHATTIAVAGRAAVIVGPSGAGKSDLALRCLTLGVSPLVPTAAQLVADDQTLIARRGLSLIATAPDAIARRIEARGIGVLTCESVAQATVALIVDVGARDAPSRFPDPWPRQTLLGLLIPVLRLRPFEASAAAKVLIALRFPDLPEAAVAPRDAAG
ncbi:MAG: HPr kinase/phosphorylase [Hyphomicrobium sp.]